MMSGSVSPPASTKSRVKMRDTRVTPTILYQRPRPRCYGQQQDFKDQDSATIPPLPHCKSCFSQLVILPSTLSSGFYVADGSWTHWCTCLLMSASLCSSLPQHPVSLILHNSFLCGSNSMRTTAAMTACGSDKEVVCNSAFHEQTLKCTRFP